MSLTIEELEQTVGKDFATKAYKIQCVYEYLYDNIPKPSHFDAGYGWRNVHDSLRTNEIGKQQIREVAMMAAISIVLGVSPELAKKATSMFGPIIWEKEKDASLRKIAEMADRAAEEQARFGPEEDRMGLNRDWRG